MRLIVATEEELASGRGQLAKVLNYSERRSNEVLRELSLKGYISFDTVGGGRPTRVIIERRALINARAHHFARLADVTMLAFGASAPRLTHVGNNTFTVSVGLSQAGVGLSQGKSRTFPGQESDFPRQPLSATIGTGVSDARSTCVEGCVQSTLAATKFAFDGDCERVKFVAEGAYKEAFAAGPRIGSISMVERIRGERQRIRAERSEARATNARDHSTAQKIQGRVPGTIDWVQLDRYEDPVLTFDPGSRKHPLFITILDRPKSDKSRQALVDKIATEFSRIYTRYRREAERRRKLVSTYNVSTEERRYAEEAGIMCLRKGVTPRQLLQYWDANIGNFAQRDMVLPPLSFLKSPANIDRVACSSMSAPAALGAPSAPDSPKPAAGNSYTATGRLHPDLRKTLEGGGFKTQAYNDRYLLTLQHNAELLAKGTKVFMAAGKAKEMAEFVAEVLFTP